MATSIIKSVTPQIQNGVQRSWTNKFTGKANYGFIISFADGITGNCGSEKTIYPLPVGTEITYEITTTTTGMNLISKVKKVEEIALASGKTYNDPDTVKRVAFSMCQTIARQHYTNTGVSPRNLQDVIGLARIYNNWVISNIADNDPHFRDNISRKYYALQLAVDCIPFSSLGILRKEQVIESAETFLKPLMEIGNEPLV